MAQASWEVHRLGEARENRCKTLPKLDSGILVVGGIIREVGTDFFVALSHVLVLPLLGWVQAAAVLELGTRRPARSGSAITLTTFAFTALPRAL